MTLTDLSYDGNISEVQALEYQEGYEYCLFSSMIQSFNKPLLPNSCEMRPLFVFSP